MSLLQLDNDFSLKTRSNISSRKSKDFNHDFLDLQWHPKEGIFQIMMMDWISLLLLVSILVSTTLKGSVIIWDIAKTQKGNNGTEIGRHSSCCYSASWDPFHNTQLLTSSEDGHAILWVSEPGCFLYFRIVDFLPMNMLVIGILDHQFVKCVSIQPTSFYSPLEMKKVSFGYG